MYAIVYILLHVIIKPNMDNLFFYLAVLDYSVVYRRKKKECCKWQPPTIFNSLFGYMMYRKALQ